MASERYVKIKDIIQDKWILGCPVEIDKGALLLDNQTKQVILQIRLRNVSDLIINQVDISVFGYDLAGDPIDKDEKPLTASIIDVSANPGESFGDKTPIILGANQTRQIKIIYSKVVFSDGSAWRNENLSEGEQINQRKLVDVFPVEIIEQFNREYSELGLAKKNWVHDLEPQFLADRWICTCGFPNRHDTSYCCRCKIGREWIEKVADKAYLEQALGVFNFEKGKAEEEARQARLKAEEESRIKSENETAARLQILRDKKDAKNKRNRIIRKFALIGIPVIAIIVGAIIIINTLILPSVRYNHAQELLSKKDFDNAIKGFSELGDYKDSPTMILESNYRKAQDFINNKKYDQAYILLNQLGDYKNSAEQVFESEYQRAKEYIDIEEYDQANTLLNKLGDYKDSAEILNLSKYNEATKLYEKNMFEDAIKLFVELKGYKDSDEKVKQSYYYFATTLFENKKYEDAAENYRLASGYLDSVEKLKSSKYMLAKEFLNNNKFREASNILSDIIDFKDSKLLLEKIGKEVVLNSEIGDIVNYGKYEQDNDLSNGRETIQWMVLAKEDGMTLLLAKKPLDAKQYNSNKGSVTWRTSTLRQWLNSSFFNTAFNSEEQQSIVDISGDKVSLLNIDEASKYFNSDSERTSVGTPYANSRSSYGGGNSDWWLKSTDSNNFAPIVHASGSIINEYYIGYVTADFIYVRPIIWVG